MEKEKDNFGVEFTTKANEALEKAIDLLSNLSQTAVMELRDENSRFNKNVEELTQLISGSPDKLWAQHPEYSFITCSKNGDIKLSPNANCEIRYNDNVPFLHYLRSRKPDVLGAIIILQCFVECPGSLSEYTVHYKDGDPSNLKFANLGWARKYVAR